MQESIQPEEKFEPELFCLRCPAMEWDEQARQCANFGDQACPLFIRQVLAGLQISCLVV